MANKCETKSDEGECGKPGKYKVTPKWDVKKSFIVCEDCIPAYQYVQMREYGNKESNFIVKELDVIVSGDEE